MTAYAMDAYVDDDGFDHFDHRDGDDDDDLLDRVHSLSDLELAVLLSLVSREHCVIGTPAAAVDELVDELRLVGSGRPLPFTRTYTHQTGSLQISAHIFGLACAVVDCDGGMTPDDFAAMLVQPAAAAAAPNSNSNSSSSQSGSPKNGDSSEPPHRSPDAAALSVPASAPPPLLLPNVVVARHLNRAPTVVQIQALELLRTGRLPVAGGGVRSGPLPFLVVAVVAAERGFFYDAGRDAGSQQATSTTRSPHLNAHLNDLFAMGHWHDPEDGYPNLDEEDEGGDDGDNDDDDADSRSVVRRRRARAVRLDVEVHRYLLNVVAFLRMHRAVAVLDRHASGASSVSPTATKHCAQLARCLAPLHGLDYVSPALVGVAARKAYLHRLRTVAVGDGTGNGVAAGNADDATAATETPPLHERSMQWGSERAAVAALLAGTSPADVLDDVLGTVVPPV
ncbi:hypothetical protein SPI_05585 [Niveomyces insectorum RCEF 264]|uniref:magnesium chelatase n=1 Tax=Niveomyces insectorum RCEF 264 TaxID=1081102 RepID=A0A167TCN7_9HYPO|nr:hypothetical protein SPI_05585 [Niveomyces insectorum RCEF 264]